MFHLFKIRDLNKNRARTCETVNYFIHLKKTFKTTHICAAIKEFLRMLFQAFPDLTKPSKVATEPFFEQKAKFCETCTSSMIIKWYCKELYMLYIYSFLAFLKLSDVWLNNDVVNLICVTPVVHGKYVKLKTYSIAYGMISDVDEIKRIQNELSM